MACARCATNACFICQKPWHEGRCTQEDRVIKRFFFNNRDVRKCPNCKVRIQKDGACTHMRCLKCNYEFCWCCMREYSCHSTWYSRCPGLPFSLCVNLMCGIFGTIFIPIVLACYPLWFAIDLYIDTSSAASGHCGICGNYYGKTFWYIFGLFTYLPIYLILGVLASVFLVVFGTIPCFIWGLAYCIRLIYNISR